MSITGGAIGASINGDGSLIMETWSAFPAQFNLNMNSKTIYNASSITTGTLNYTTLNPPISGGGENIEQTLTLGDDANFENLSNISSLTQVQSGFLDPDAINNTIRVGQLSGLGGRLNVWQDGDTTSPFNSSAILATGQGIFGGGIQVGSQQNPSNINLDGALVINQDGTPTGSTTLSANASNQLVTSGGLQVGNLTTGSVMSSGFHSIYPLDGFKYVLISSKSVGALGTGTLVLTSNAGTPAGTGNLECNNITCNQLNYTTLNPPISGGGETLAQTLTLGNDATGQNITNVGSLFTGSIEGTGTNGLLEIGNNPLNTYVNDNGAGTPEISLGFCQLNMGGNKIINLNDPVSSDEPATKNYVDTRPQSGTTYISGTPWAISVNIPNTGASTPIYTSGAFSKPSGQSIVLNITFNNANILSGSNNTNLITGIVEFSQTGSLWTPSTIDPYGSGFLFSPAFSAFVSIPSAWTTYYFRISGSQTNVSVPSYALNANILLVAYQG
jgi:hypothetical protein